MARDRLMDSIENLADSQNEMRQKIKRLESEKADLLKAAARAVMDFEEHQIIFRNRGDIMRTADCTEQIESLESAIAKARPTTPDTTKRGSRRRFGGHPPRQARPAGGA